MKSSLRWFTVAACSTLLVTGCKKNETAESLVPRSAEKKSPMTEPVDPAVDPVAAAPTATSPGAPDAAPAPVTATAANPGADQAAYEAWFKKHHLDLNDPKMLDADPDGDGFTNREEFLADTDPNDKNSRPGIHKSIRLKEYSEVRVPLLLESIDGEKARLKRTDQPEGKPLTVKVGDTVHGWKVTQVEEKEDFDKGGERVNLSHVALEDASTKEKIMLMKELPARTAATYAVLVSPDGKTTLKVHKGDTFTWPVEQASRYKVIDLSQDQAVLLQLNTNTTWTIPRL